MASYSLLTIKKQFFRKYLSVIYTPIPLKSFTNQTKFEVRELFYSSLATTGLLKLWVAKQIGILCFLPRNFLKNL